MRARADAWMEERVYVPGRGLRGLAKEIVDAVDTGIESEARHHWRRNKYRRALQQASGGIAQRASARLNERVADNRPITRDEIHAVVESIVADAAKNVPSAFRKAPYVFLANIDPRLQLDVLSQVERPKLVVCDTMNFWIESRRSDLIELLKHVDVLMVNDAEARQLTEHNNLVKAARWILARGPKFVVIKKGELEKLISETMKAASDTDQPVAGNQKGS